MKEMFCPKCKSNDISKPIPQAFIASTGLDVGWRCNNCGLELPEFPTKETIKKIIKKKITKTKKTTKNNLISKNMTFAEILEKHPEAGNILFESGLHCIGCGGAMYETLEQGCMMHGMGKKEIDDLIKRLNRKGK